MKGGVRQAAEVNTPGSERRCVPPGRYIVGRRERKRLIKRNLGGAARERGAADPDPPLNPIVPLFKLGGFFFVRLVRDRAAPCPPRLFPRRHTSLRPRLFDAPLCDHRGECAHPGEARIRVRVRRPSHPCIPGNAPCPGVRNNWEYVSTPASTDDNFDDTRLFIKPVAPRRHVRRGRNNWEYMNITASSC